MPLTPKEKDFLKDFQKQEQLCIDKYRKYENAANDEALKTLFASLRCTEEAHKATVEDILAGNTPKATPAPSAVSQSYEGVPSKCKGAEKANDAYLCEDALSMEKHVAAGYNTGVFEFNSPELRDVLGHIQKEEQNHGEQIYQYMALNKMY